jgi:hypothetical protein
VLALVDGHPEIDGKAFADRVRATALDAHGLYRKTFDERYARVALALERAYFARDRGDAAAKDKDDYLEQLESGIASGPRAGVLGDFDKASIRSAIRVRSAQIRRCYERVVARDPDVAGRVAMTFVVEDGQVVDVSSVPAGGTAGLPAVAGCVADELRRLVLPHAAYSSATTINYPFVFRRSGV